MITIEELKDILKKRKIYDIKKMVTYSRGRLYFAFCPINNKELISDVFVITNKNQNTKWEHVRTIHKMLNRARIHHTTLLTICVFNNSKGFKLVADGNDDILIVGKDFQNDSAVMQILNTYSIW